ncbi:MAG: acetoacetate decarboxylase family protein [Desulfobacterales bacterium]|nr:acetoacetate decarboxylase family protein [Desulfobacterales bacterium]
MKPFFSNTRPGKEIILNENIVELPILYYRDDFFVLYFTGNTKKMIEMLPSENLYPVVMPNGKALIGVGAFNYIETTIGSYGEVAIVIPVVYGKKTSAFTGLIPVFMESWYPGFGLLVMHLPVTGLLARDGGRQGWGYTKFMADMHFIINSDYFECQMHDEDCHILTIRVQKKGILMKDTRPITTYSVLNNNLIKTIIPQRCVKRMAIQTRGSCLKLGNHPVAESIRALGISRRPFMTAYYPERSVILPLGNIIETDVSPFDGYIGKNREAKHTIEYS